MAQYIEARPRYSGTLEEKSTTAAPGMAKITNMIDIPHRKVKKIACLGSGFVGGMKAIPDILLFLVLWAD